MRALRSLILSALLLALAGCASWGPGGRPHVHRDGYTVTVPAGWIYHPSQGGELLATREGLVLQRLTIRRLQLPYTLAKSKRELRPGLSGYELAEIFADEGRADRQLARFSIERQAAVRIGGREGVRYDYAHATEDGLRLSGRRWLVPDGDTLWIATYVAPSRHYFERDLATVSSAVEAASFAAPAAGTAR